MASEDDSSLTDSLEGLHTRKFCKIVECAGHQVLFRYELGAGTITKIAEISVPGLGMINYKSPPAPCEGPAEALRWLDAVDGVAARRALNWIKKKIVDRIYATPPSERA